MLVSHYFKLASVSGKSDWSSPMAAAIHSRFITPRNALLLQIDGHLQVYCVCHEVNESSQCYQKLE